MTNHIGNYDHNTFGGEIYETDFYTSYPMTHNMASRILSDWSFDKSCKKNILDREDF